MKAFNPIRRNYGGGTREIYEPAPFEALAERFRHATFAIVSGIRITRNANGETRLYIEPDFMSKLYESLAALGLCGAHTILLPKEGADETEEPVRVGAIFTASELRTIKGASRKLSKLLGQQALLLKQAESPRWQLVPISAEQKSFPRKLVQDIGELDISKFDALFSFLISQAAPETTPSPEAIFLTKDFDRLQIEFFVKTPSFFSRELHIIYFCKADESSANERVLSGQKCFANSEN